MKFDNLYIAACQAKKQAIATVNCPVIIDPGGGGGDPTVETLIIKPAAATTEIGKSVQFRTFLVSDSGKEAEVKKGVTYRSADQGTAVIGAIGGSATGVAVGVVTISAEYNGKFAYAQLTVISSCAALQVSTAIVIDRSDSMGQDFPGYGTKLDFAKQLARNYVTQSNLAKDPVSLVAFDVAAELRISAGHNAALLTASIDGIASGNNTNLGAGLKAAIDDLKITSGATDRQVVILLSDGVNKQGPDPVLLARSFKAGGGIIIVVAERTDGVAYSTLKKIATDGFFLSAFPATAKDTISLFSGLRAYLCSCTSKGDQSLATPQLNFNNFANWDVDGVVDLIGNGGERVLFDLIPGNGMYVDLVGSSAPWLGTVTSKKAFAFINGRQYKLSYKLSGNQRKDEPGYTVETKVGTLLSTTVTMDDWKQDFTLMTNLFNGDGGSHKVSFRQVSVAPTSIGTGFGTMVDYVKVEDMVTGEVVFFDSFDDENSTYQPPGCGTPVHTPYGGQFTYGYDCYSPPCNPQPVPAQREDPAPPVDNEVPVPPTLFTATASYTAKCSLADGPDVTSTMSASSSISVQDAYNKALAAATDDANTRLRCGCDLRVGNLINVVTRPGGRTDLPVKVGFAAIGNSSSDVWNFVDQAIFSDNEGKRTCLEKYGAWGPLDIIEMVHPDLMYRYATSSGTILNAYPITLTLRKLPPGTYDIYMYGHGPAPAKASRFALNTGKLLLAFGGYQLDPGQPKVSYGVGQTTSSAQYLDAGFQEAMQYLRFKDVIIDGSANNGVELIALPVPGQDNLTWFQGFQIVRKT